MKKKFFKIVASFAAIILLIILIATVCFYVGPSKVIAYFSAFTFSDEFSSENIPLSLKNYDMLNENEKIAYISVINNIRSHPEYIKIPDLSSDEFNNVFFAVKNDNPDILCFSDSCNMISFLSASFLQLHYDNDYETCNRMMDEMNTVADKIIENMTASSDIEKELYIHDYIVNNCNYNDVMNASNAYGCLVGKEAVCSGYSRAAMLLFSKAGIQSMVLAGTGITPSQGNISHMWNIVWIDGEPYHFDVTWDDPVSDSNSAVSHLYFNITDEQVSTDHIDFSTDVLCSADKYNYFVYNELMYDRYDKNILQDICFKLSENIKQGHYYIEIQFSDDDSYVTAVEKLIGKSSVSSDMYTVIEYLTKNAGDTVDVTHVSFSKDESKRYIRLMFDSN